jgi:hypothetical protein
MRPSRRILIGLLCVLPGIVIAACGHGEVEDAQRAWLEDQHRVEKRMLAVRRDYEAQRRTLVAPSSSAPADDSARARRERALAMLHRHEAALQAIDSVIEKQALSRDVAIRAGQMPAIRAAWDSAKVVFARQMATLDSIAREQRAIRAQ